MCASLCRLLYTWWTMARQAQSAVTDARPTCVPTCSLLTEVAATSVVSATVSMKVQHNANKQTKSLSSCTCTVLIHRATLWTQNGNKNVKLWIYCAQFYIHLYFMSYPSAGLLFPTSRPHGPEGGLLREAWAVPGVLRVCRHPGLLQGTGRLLKNCWLLFNTQQCIADEVDQYRRAPQFSVIHQELIISKLNAGQEVLSSVLLETDANQLHVPMEAVENNIRGLE